jgi:hypothetical protein
MGALVIQTFKDANLNTTVDNDAVSGWAKLPPTSLHPAYLTNPTEKYGNWQPVMRSARDWIWRLDVEKVILRTYINGRPWLLFHKMDLAFQIQGVTVKWIRERACLFCFLMLGIMVYQIRSAR